MKIMLIDNLYKCILVTKRKSQCKLGIDYYIIYGCEKKFC